MSYNTSSSSDSLLCEIDVNIQQQLDNSNFFLPVPKHLWNVQSKKDKHRCQGGGTSPKNTAQSNQPSTEMTCVMLQKSMRNALCNLELMYTNDTERLKQRLSEEFHRLRESAAERTRQLIDLSTKAQPLSYRVLFVLNLRRWMLCRGFEFALQDLKDWLRLALLLRETDTLHFLRECTKKLGPYARQRVEDALILHGSDIDSVCQVVMDIPVPTDETTTFGGPYYNLTLNDLIAMGDEDTHSVHVVNAQHTMPSHVREGLVEWMLLVNVELNLQLETFFLAVSILDRYLLRATIQPDREYLTAYAILLLASKVEEKCLFPLRDSVRLCGKTYKVGVLIATTNRIFEVLDCNVVYATLSNVGFGFLWQQEPAACEKQYSFLTYILTTLAIRTQYRQYRLSALAAAAVYVSRLRFNIPTGRPCDEVVVLLPVIKDAISCNISARSGGVYDLFKRSCFHEASRFPLPDLLYGL
ncbi:cyclin CycB3 [Trypanosoma brucei gambiense DAL972]|uniref:Mitotic cyclin n=3 Tax=Trypanosoma brucei TaxID=5691 RepID=C9ZS50_TRYB9|nr:cyclin CycB3 [Trypanosoma brucei gambiense DAL972]AAN77908.2 putative mitotic B-type cyclin CycB3 [Trypanosoma brucei]CBH12186.1 cyclin CycB3 [Trypanosoma brucei gambiense DAL972]|eukprot:XP_011774469.1 cyclin CycB3 [Trypanosoma brucei gambiense DAL972]